MSSGLDKIIARERNLAQFADFDRLMQESFGKLPGNTVGDKKIEIAWALFNFFKDHIYMMRVISLKLSEVARAIVSAKSDKNATVYISLARAFFEHTASSAYQKDILRKAMEEFPKEHSKNRLLAAIMRRHDELKMLYYSSGDGKGRFVHINKMIEAMQKEHGGAKKQYDALCDYVHPNFGSNKLVSSGVLGTGVLAAGFECFADEIGFADSVIDDCLSFIFSCEMDTTFYLNELNLLINLAIDSGTKITQLFAPRYSHIGDGKTKETALYFSKARTHAEALQAYYKYLSDNRLVQKGKQTVELSGGYMYEIVSIDGGNIWVKYKEQAL